MTVATLQSLGFPTYDAYGSLLNVLLCYESDFEECVSPFALQKESRATFSFGLHCGDYVPKHLALQDSSIATLKFPFGCSPNLLYNSLSLE